MGMNSVDHSGRLLQSAAEIRVYPTTVVNKMEICNSGGLGDVPTQLHEEIAIEYWTKSPSSSMKHSTISDRVIH